MKWFTRTAVWVFAVVSAAPAVASEARTYLGERVEAYEQAIERCEKQVRARSLPGDELLEQLRQYELKQVRVFLIARAQLLESQCERPELTELSYAIGMLKRLDLSGKTAGRLKAVEDLLYTPSPWRFRERYESLPESMREALEGEAYFQEPFDGVAVLEAMRAE
ncbi:hypothetical protein [Halospina sp. K52047b]|uniref:hypothetical protein n=1 Tax=Halospina sp. K52047b TaxID=2614160 RepID=UPI001249F5E7|nr:hypothetical protein [Halospina sp. K52047b]KAA8985525.1 hypothetical protein F3089_02350 [Halospina sp. K52047b]